MGRGEQKLGGEHLFYGRRVVRPAAAAAAAAVGSDPVPTPAEALARLERAIAAGKLKPLELRSIWRSARFQGDPAGNERRQVFFAHLGAQPNTDGELEWRAVISSGEEGEIRIYNGSDLDSACRSLNRAIKRGRARWPDEGETSFGPEEARPGDVLAQAGLLARQGRGLFDARRDRELEEPPSAWEQGLVAHPQATPERNARTLQDWHDVLAGSSSKEEIDAALIYALGAGGVVEDSRLSSSGRTSLGDRWAREHAHRMLGEDFWVKAVESRMGRFISNARYTAALKMLEDELYSQIVGRIRAQILERPGQVGSFDYDWNGALEEGMIEVATEELCRVTDDEQLLALLTRGDNYEIRRLRQEFLARRLRAGRSINELLSREARRVIVEAYIRAFDTDRAKNLKQALHSELSKALGRR